jgi:hypothetical protein
MRANPQDRVILDHVQNTTENKQLRDDFGLPATAVRPTGRRHHAESRPPTYSSGTASAACTSGDGTAPHSLFLPYTDAGDDPVGRKGGATRLGTAGEKEKRCVREEPASSLLEASVHPTPKTSHAKTVWYSTSKHQLCEELECA